MSRCAYCLREGRKLSREHLVPRSIAELLTEGEKSHYFLEKSDVKFVVKGPTVRDVCEECNNGPLSQLDTYAHILLRDYCNKFLSDGESVCVKYDWDILMRWILKVHFNSSRINDRDVELLSQTRDYILGVGKRPKRIRLLAFALKPHRLSEDEKAHLESKGLSTDFVDPEMFRISVAVSPMVNFRGGVVRMIFYKSIGFTFLLLPKKTAAKDLDEMVEEYRKGHLKAKIVCPEKNVIRLKADAASHIEALQFHHLYFEDDYERLDGWMKSQNLK